METNSKNFVLLKTFRVPWLEKNTYDSIIISFDQQLTVKLPQSY